MSYTKHVKFGIAEVVARLAGTTVAELAKSKTRNGHRRRPRPETEAKAQSERGVESSVAGSGE